LKTSKIHQKNRKNIFWRLWKLNSKDYSLSPLLPSSQCCLSRLNNLKTKKSKKKETRFLIIFRVSWLEVCKASNNNWSFMTSAHQKSASLRKSKSVPKNWLTRFWWNWAANKGTENNWEWSLTISVESSTKLWKRSPTTAESSKSTSNLNRNTAQKSWLSPRVSWEKSSARLWRKSGCITTRRTGSSAAATSNSKRKSFTSTWSTSPRKFTLGKSSL